MDRQKKLILIGGAALLLIIIIIVIMVISSNNNKNVQPTPTPVITIEPTQTPEEPTPTPTIIPTPTATPTIPEPIGLPNEPSQTPSPSATPTTSPTLPSGTSTTPKPTTASSTGTKTNTTTPVYDFGLPSVANIGTKIAVTTSAINIDNVQWTLNKSGILGIQTQSNMASEITGALTRDGGTISFNNAGKYKVTAVASNNASGKSVTVSQEIEILPVGKFAFAIPKYAYTDTVVDVTVLDDTEAATWSVTKDGAALSLQQAYSGTLSNKGGFITFRQAGKYNLSATSTTGKTYHADITVYPLLRIPFTVPAYSYRNTVFDVIMGDLYLEGQTIAWSVAKGTTPIEYSGTLTNDGGQLSIAELGTYSITASVTDPKTGRIFTTTKKIIIRNQPPNTPEGNANVTTTRSGNKLLVEFTAHATDPDNDPVTLEWDGRPSGDYFTVGQHNVRVRARDSIGDYSPWLTIRFEVPNSPPNPPEGEAVIHRNNVVNRKAYVTFTAEATDPDGDPLTYEWTDTAQDGYYPLGTHCVRVRARDPFDAVSEWTTITFEVTNNAPERPVITRSPSTGIVFTGTPVTITATAHDPDGDAVEYIWEGRPSETYTYPDGRVVISVRAVDAFGATSPTRKIMFLMGDPNRAGNLMLTGPDSTILEPGIEDATVIWYKFVVPPVPGHSGQDYGRVRGYNRLTGQWEQLDYGNTSNGISFERTLPAGIYTMIEFYYYTNHNCMYGLSNITANTLFEFDDIAED